MRRYGNPLGDDVNVQKSQLEEATMFQKVKLAAASLACMVVLTSAPVRAADLKIGAL